MNQNNYIIDSNKVKAVIFDLDGLLVDSEKIALKSWRMACKRLGYVLSDELFISGVGRDVEFRRQSFLNFFGKEFPFDQILAIKQSIEKDIEGHIGVNPKLGARALLQKLKHFEIRSVVATGSNNEVAHRRLIRSGLYEFFQIIVTSSDVKKLKPHPDLLIKSLDKLGLNSVDCISLDDTFVGAEAAESAGIFSIVIPDMVEHSNYNMTFVLNSLNDIMVK